MPEYIHSEGGVKVAFVAVFHGLSDPGRKQELYQSLVEFRAEKTIKVLKESGVTNDTIQACIESIVPSNEITMTGSPTTKEKANAS
jgi:hypothetical protein